MSRATSEAQDRVIEKASEEMTMMIYAEPFLTAEIEYRTPAGDGTGCRAARR